MGSGQMMPELGSRISLISKADIRYEGRLFTVDPQECTIALANGEYFLLIFFTKEIFSENVLLCVLLRFILQSLNNLEFSLI